MEQGAATREIPFERARRHLLRIHEQRRGQRHPKTESPTNDHDRNEQRPSENQNRRNRRCGETVHHTGHLCVTKTPSVCLSDVLSLVGTRLCH